MQRIAIAAALLVLIGSGIAVAASTSDSPLPTNPDRADCPGLIECPITGDMICADECPLDGEAAEGVPPCCRDRK